MTWIDVSARCFIRLFTVAAGQSLTAQHRTVCYVSSKWLHLGGDQGGMKTPMTTATGEDHALLADTVGLAPARYVQS